MSYQVHDDVIDQIWRDLGQQVDRPMVARIAREVAADLGDATVPGYVPLFVRRMTCERLSLEAARQNAASPGARA